MNARAELMPSTTVLPQQQMAVAHDVNPYLSMVQTMVGRGGDLANLDKMLDLQMKWEGNEARKAYVAAVAAFKANPPRVYKDKENLQYGSRYTTIGNMVNTVSEAMGPHGLSASWEIVQNDKIEVTCILTHVMGHSERVTLKGPPDKSGAKNDLQQIKSTLTYLKLASFEAVTGTASEEGNRDDDGNGYSGATEPEPLDAKAADWIAQCGRVQEPDDLAPLKVKMLADYGGTVKAIPDAVKQAFVDRKAAVMPKDSE